MVGPLVFPLAWGHDDARASPVDGLFFALVVPLWFGHRVSSAWLAHATPAYRPLLATQRLRFVVAPMAIMVACFALLLAPESVLPMPLAERVVWLAVLNYLLVSHHSAAQHFGLLSLYRARDERRTRSRDGSTGGSRSSWAAVSSCWQRPWPDRSPSRSAGSTRCWARAGRT